LGAGGGGALKDLVDALQSECFGRAIAVSLALDNATGDEQQDCTFFQADGRGLAGGVRKESQWKSGGSKFGDSSVIAEKGGSVPAIGVAEGAELFVIAADEGRAGVDALADVDQSAIEAEAEVGHGFGFVDIGAREGLCPNAAEDLLRGDEDAAVVLAASGDVEQADENALGAGADGVVKIAGNAFADKDGSDVSALDLGEHSWHGFNSYDRCGTRRAEAREHGRTSSGKLAQESRGSNRTHYKCRSGAALREILRFARPG